MNLTDEQITLLRQATRDKMDFKKLKECEFVLMERNSQGELIGLAGIVKRHHLFNSVFLVVKKEYQGQGIGKKLFARLWESQSTKPLLTFYKDNLPAKKIYKKYYWFLPYLNNKWLGVPRFSIKG